jgi:hypothetical protein
MLSSWDLPKRLDEKSFKVVYKYTSTCARIIWEPQGVCRG